mgnify:CR=1 FL=1
MASALAHSLGMGVNAGHDLSLDNLKDFAAAIRDGRPPLVSGRDALVVHRLITALEMSAASGSRVAPGDL